MDKVSQILNLCEEYKKSIVTENGIAIGADSEKFALINNNILPHMLNYEELQASCVGLNNILLYKGLNTIVREDHFWFWSWIGEVLLSRETGYFNNNEREIEKLFGTLIRLSLAGIRPPVNGVEEWRKQNDEYRIKDSNANEVISNTSIILAYLAFPFLESTLKKCCNSFVDYSGKVKKSFKKGAKEFYRVGSTCSSLKDLLYLYYNNISDPLFKRKFDIFFDAFTDFSNKKPFNLIYEWRNTSLHGSTNYSTIGGTILNLSIMIALNEMKDIYDSKRNKIFEQVMWEVKTAKYSTRSPWSYYPPYL